MRGIRLVALCSIALGTTATDVAAISEEPPVDQQLERFMRLPMVEQKRIREEAHEFRQLPQEEKDELCRKFYSEHGYLPPRCE